MNCFSFPSSNSIPIEYTRLLPAPPGFGRRERSETAVPFFGKKDKDKKKEKENKEEVKNRHVDPASLKTSPTNEHITSPPTSTRAVSYRPDYGLPAQPAHNYHRTFHPAYTHKSSRRKERGGEPAIRRNYVSAIAFLYASMYTY